MAPLRIAQGRHRHRRGKGGAAALQCDRAAHRHRRVIGHVRQLHRDGRVRVVLLRQPIQQRLQLLRRFQRRVLRRDAQRLLLLKFHGHGQVQHVAALHAQRPDHLVVGAGGIRTQPPVQQRRGLRCFLLRVPQLHPAHALRRGDGHVPAVQQRGEILRCVVLGHGVLHHDGGGEVIAAPIGDQPATVAHRRGGVIEVRRHGGEHMVLPPVPGGIVGLAGRQIGIRGRIGRSGRIGCAVRALRLRFGGRPQPDRQGNQRRGKARRQQVKAAVRTDKQREQAEKSGNRTRRTFDRGGR